MSVYINGIGTVSSQTIDTRSLELNLSEKQSNRYLCIEPDYKDLIPPMQLRRMSKVIRIGIASAKQALSDAGLETPDIITLGTAYGCLSDTENFLGKILTQNENMLTPTAFIQSTHNTVSGQIALLTQCFGHNFTYVHKGHSFETALQESMMWMKENESIENFSALIGGIDEMPNDTFDIISRFGTYKNEDENFESQSEGTIAGEGANLFVVSHQKNDNSYAKCLDVCLVNHSNIQESLHDFLAQNDLNEHDIDTCLVGINGDTRYDELILNNLSTLKSAELLGFKKYCGEYPTSNAFAFCLGSLILKNQVIPDKLYLKQSSIHHQTPKNVLIYNHYKNRYHSFILLQRI
ncbi:MAG TPA: beta-ketoacyl synthase chain length factor [Chitinophagaceae bacterium]|nr:beta-ketoacyl synthase chain length factor [Chitinophagaceae bacterium]